MQGQTLLTSHLYLLGVCFRPNALFLLLARVFVAFPRPPVLPPFGGGSSFLNPGDLTKDSKNCMKCFNFGSFGGRVMLASIASPSFKYIRALFCVCQRPCTKMRSKLWCFLNQKVAPPRRRLRPELLCHNPKGLHTIVKHFPPHLGRWSYIYRLRR